MTTNDFFTFIFCPVAGFWMTFQNVQLFRRRLREKPLSRFDLIFWLIVLAVGPLCLLLIPLSRLDFIPLHHVMTTRFLIPLLVVAGLVLTVFLFRWKRDWDENNKPLQ
jgi:hypothetical protein